MPIYIHASASALTLTSDGYTLILSTPTSPTGPIATSFLPTAAAATRLAGQVKWWAEPIEAVACLGLVRVGDRLFLIAVTKASIVVEGDQLSSGFGGSVMRLRTVRFFALGDDLPLDASHVSHPCHELDSVLTEGRTYFTSGKVSSNLLSPLLARLPPSPTYPSPPATAPAVTSSFATAPPSVQPQAPPPGNNLAGLAPVDQFRATLAAAEGHIFDQLGTFVPCLRGHVGTKVVGLGGQDVRLTVVSRVVAGVVEGGGGGGAGHGVDGVEIETLVATPTLLGSFLVVCGGRPAVPRLPVLDLAPPISTEDPDFDPALSDQVYEQGWTRVQVVDGRAAGAVSRQTQQFSSGRHDSSEVGQAAELVSRLALGHFLVEASLPTLPTQPDLSEAHGELFEELRTSLASLAPLPAPLSHTAVQLVPAHGAT